MHVVATAGHVDHGKSTLVRALTGQDPDRLEEERRRGLTIELGYCWTELPHVGEVAFVDVPGHERFLTTMLAGVGPVPAAMLVVAADDPWMPQAAEHLAALDLLGVRHAVLVVTRSDLADPGPVLARARAEVDRTSLRGAEAVVVSGRTGAGLDELRRALAALLRDLPCPDPRADVRLWVDRRFSVRGTGTVVTGTLAAGTIAAGDVLTCDGAELRVRGVQALGVPRDTVSGVARVALDVAGRAPASLTRGSVLVTPGAFELTEVVDVRLTGEDSPAEASVLHVGAAAVHARVRPLASAYARLTLERPLPLRIGDHAVLRDPGSRRMWGAEVLDPVPPALTRRGAATARAVALSGVDGTLAGELARRGVVRLSLLRRLGAVRGEPPADALLADDWVVDPGRATTLRADLERLVRDRSGALGAGVTAEEAAQHLGVAPAVVRALVTPPLAVRSGRITDTAAQVPEPLERAAAALAEELAAAPFQAPEAGRLRELGLDPAALAALQRAGLVLRLADGVVLLPGADDLAVELLASLPQPFTVSEARRTLDTSRRVALPLLALLDRTGRTVRLPDDSRRLR